MTGLAVVGIAIGLAIGALIVMAAGTRDTHGETDTHMNEGSGKVLTFALSDAKDALPCGHERAAADEDRSDWCKACEQLEKEDEQ